MKNVNFFLSTMVALSMAFTGCSNEENLPATDHRVALQVNSGIQTRAFDNQWEAGDEIGIFMLNNQQSTVADGYSNVPYQVESAGTGGKAFTPVSKTIYFPANGNKRDFVAYYPYSADKMVEGVYHLNLTQQNPQKDVDFMLAEKVTDKSRSDASVSFQFAHKLAKIVMTIEAGNGLNTEDLKNMKVSLTGQATQGTFPVLTGKNIIADANQKTGIDLLVNAAGTKAEGIVLPCENYNGMNAVFSTTAAGKYEWPLSQSTKATKFEAGKKYIYTITIHKTGLNVTSSITNWEPGNGEGETGKAE